MERARWSRFMLPLQILEVRLNMLRYSDIAFVGGRIVLTQEIAYSTEVLGRFRVAMIRRATSSSVK